MALPNKVDPFPKLPAAVKLPPRKTVSEDGVAGEAIAAPAFARRPRGTARAGITAVRNSLLRISFACKCFRE